MRSLAALPVTERVESLSKSEMISLGGDEGVLAAEGDDRYLLREVDERWLRNLG